MPNVEISDLIWDEYNKSHFSKHNVSLTEVGEALQDTNIKEGEAKQGRFWKLGRAGKRLLSLIIAREKDGKFYVVTARDMDKKERRIYRGDVKGGKNHDHEKEK